MLTTVDRLSRIDSDNASCYGALHLRRSWPRAGKLLLEYQREDGSTIAGQWHVDRAQSIDVAASTPGSTWLRRHGVILQPNGSDRRLTSLARLVAQPDAVLIVHRPERRAVVRRSGPRYAKVLPPKKAARALAADGAARATGAISMPKLLHVDIDAGVLEWAAVRGRSLYDLLHDDAVPLEELANAAVAVGKSLRALHDAPLPRGIAQHGPHAEAEAAAIWIRAAATHSSPPAGVWPAFAAAAEALASATSPTVLVHRDFHEQQVLIDGGHATIIDVDTIAAGEAALDLANMLVHFELRAALGLAPDRANSAASSVLDGYRPSRTIIDRIPAYGTMARIRLACLYSFRPQHAAHGSNLMAGPPEQFTRPLLT